MPRLREQHQGQHRRGRTARPDRDLAVGPDGLKDVSPYALSLRLHCGLPGAATFDGTH